MSQLHVELDHYEAAIEVSVEDCPQLEDALGRELAPAIFQCAMSYAFAALASGDAWSRVALVELAHLSQQLRDTLSSTPTIQ